MLSFKYGFGFREDVKTNILFLDNSTVIYPCGHNIIFYNIETRHQRIIPGSNEKEKIQAIAISNSKRHLAFGESGTDKNTITIFDTHIFKKKKIINLNHHHDIAYLNFNHNGKILAVQCGHPDWNLSLFLWEKSKLISSIKTSNPKGDAIIQVEFSPYDSSYISICGINNFKMLKNGEAGLKLQITALAKKDTQTYSSQSWMLDHGSERLVVGTGTGEIIILESGEIKYANLIDQRYRITAIKCYSKGFVIGTENGLIIFFEKDDKEIYKRNKSFMIPKQEVDDSSEMIKNFAISPNEEQLLCTTDKNQAYVFSINNLELLNGMDDKVLIPMSTEMHYKSILDIDISINRPIIVTSSKDRTIKIWNYKENNIELTKRFAEAATSIAIHPNGLILLASFHDKIVVMSIHMNDFKVIHEISVRGCREIKYSNGGQYFAVVNNNVIQIYQTYMYNCIGYLKGHNGKINCIYWSLDDLMILSSGSDGAIYEWSVKELKRERENVIKGCNYHSITASDVNLNQIYSIGSDHKLKSLQKIEGTGMHINKELECGVVNLTKIVSLSDGKMLFAGTSKGSIRSYPCPLNGEFMEYKCIHGPITGLMLSRDERILVATGDDGSIFLFDINLQSQDNTNVKWLDEVLVMKSEINEKDSRIVELEVQVNELTMQTEYQLRLKDLDMTEKLKTEASKYTRELEIEKQKFEAINQEKNEMEIEYEEKLRHVAEKSTHQMNALDSQYQQKIIKEVERYQLLLQEKEILNEKWDEQNALLVQSHEILIRELTEEYEEKLHSENIENEKLKYEYEKIKKEYEEIIKQMEEEGDREIEEMKEKYELSINHEKEVGLRLQGQNGIMKKKFEVVQKDIDVQKEEIKALFEEKKELYEKIVGLEKDIESLKREMRERDEMIRDKEEKIYYLKKKNQDLEKIKFVLDYKIKELKGQIEPKDNEIKEYKQQVLEMDKELQKYQEMCKSLDLMVSNLKIKEKTLMKEIVNEKKLKDRMIFENNAIKIEIDEAVKFIQDPKLLKEKMNFIYQKYIQNDYINNTKEIEIEEENKKQREYLEKTVDGLRMKMIKDSEINKIMKSKIIQENTILINEINELRKEIQIGERNKGQGKVMLEKELEVQREIINKMRKELLEKENKIIEMERKAMPKPESSNEKLPTLKII